ncbi:MAG: Na(+)-translocating NADH-quinone reductase subunit C [Hyphomicrobiales bacterium]|nr:Na(+)-translocating NADH-quinone reductase subunit C [Hyphomicrobiales bacterium]
MSDSSQHPAVGARSFSLVRWLQELPNESPAKAVIVTLLVCVVASVFVAGSAVLLRPKQIANRQLAQERQIVEILQGAPAAHDTVGQIDVRDLEARVVELATGNYAEAMDAARFDERRMIRSPTQSVTIAADQDLAQIKSRAKYAVVHVLMRGGKPQFVVLPIRGLGFGSMLYGYIGLSGDTETVVGLGFYEHGETPGLGALIDDPAWRRMWSGKKVWQPGGEVGLGVARGPVVPGTAESRHYVDGITGATWTGQGVTNLLRYWLGEHGFGPYLKKLRRSSR